MLDKIKGVIAKGKKEAKEIKEDVELIVEEVKDVVEVLTDDEVRTNKVKELRNKRKNK